MKNSFLKRLLRVSCAVFLVLVLLFTSQVPSASWSRFGSLTQQWIQGSWLVLTEKPVIDVVSADDIENLLSNWQSWPSSRKHKTFNGGWVLPFEMYDQKYYRGQVSPYRQPEYKDLPVSIDINGDGLLDLVYSKPNLSYNTGNNSYIWNGVEQYIILRRADGFELAYKCRQENQNNIFVYYGDCADTTYQNGTEPAYEMRWTPMNIMYQQAKTWTNQHPIRTDQHKAEYWGKAQNGVFDFIYQDFWFNSTQRYSSDRSKPLFKDLNGDGLQDVIFFGTSDAGPTYSGGTNPQYELNFVMYNNGHGFDLVAACIQRPGDWLPGNPLPSFLSGVPQNNGHHCF